jgi:hypothetical protein
MEVNVFWRHLVMTNKQMTWEWRDISAGCFFSERQSRPTITPRVAGYELQMTWVIEFKAQVPSSGDTIHLRPRVSLPVTSERASERDPPGRGKKKKFILRAAFLRGPSRVHPCALLPRRTHIRKQYFIVAHDHRWLFLLIWPDQFGPCK